MTSDPPLIRLEGLSKRFGRIYANREITLDIHAGQIKTLLGENGAGKSTLMGMLAGRLRPDEGRILVEGRPRVFASARDAIREGIGMVYQHFMLVDAMTVAENIFLGHPGDLLLKSEAMDRQIADLARDVRLDIDPETAFPPQPGIDLRRTHGRTDPPGSQPAIRSLAAHGAAGQGHCFHQP